MNDRRILLKLSGEMLKGSSPDTFDATVLTDIAQKIQSVFAKGIEIGIVIGGGNIFRGAIGNQNGGNRILGDHMGMLATVINGLAIKEFLSKQDIPAIIQSSFAIEGICEKFNAESANLALSEKKVVIFVGGTGNPFFSTDTAAVLRAREIKADVILKATKVDGVYEQDPKKFPNAKRIPFLTFSEALSKKLEIMDLTAFSLCSGSGLSIVIFDLAEPDSLCKVLEGNFGSRISDHPFTQQTYGHSNSRSK